MKKKPAKLRLDANEIAFRVLQESIGEAPKTLPPSERTAAARNAEAVKRGRKGGKKGGKARAKKLGAKKRRSIAKNAAAARWRD